MSQYLVKMTNIWLFKRTIHFSSVHWGYQRLVKQKNGKKFETPFQFMFWKIGLRYEQKTLFGPSIQRDNCLRNSTKYICMNCLSSCLVSQIRKIKKISTYLSEFNKLRRILLCITWYTIFPMSYFCFKLFIVKHCLDALFLVAIFIYLHSIIVYSKQ